MDFGWFDPINWSDMLSAGALIVAGLSYWQSRRANTLSKDSYAQSRDVANKEFRARVAMTLGKGTFDTDGWHKVTATLSNEGKATAFGFSLNPIPEDCSVRFNGGYSNTLVPGLTTQLHFEIQPEAWFIPFGPYERAPFCRVRANFRDLYGAHQNNFRISFRHVEPAIVGAVEDGKPHFQHPEIGEIERASRWPDFVMDRWKSITQWRAS